MVYTRDLKSLAFYTACGFESHPGHIFVLCFLTCLTTEGTVIILARVLLFHFSQPQLQSFDFIVMSQICSLRVVHPGARSNSTRDRDAARARAPLRFALKDQRLSYFTPESVEEHKRLEFQHQQALYARNAAIFDGAFHFLLIVLVVGFFSLLFFDHSIIAGIGALILAGICFKRFKNTQAAAYDKFGWYYQWKILPFRSYKERLCPELREFGTILDDFFWRRHRLRVELEIETLGPDPILWVRTDSERYAIAICRDPNDRSPVIARIW